MKQLTFALVLVLASLTACNMGPSSAELKQRNDSLFLATAEKDRQMNELITALVEIDENLAQIKEKENIISVNANEAQNNEKIQDQINQDIKLIYDLMVQNQEKIADLEKQLKRSNSDNANMKKLIASLNEQLKEKSLEIVMLNEQLKQKNIEIADLTFTIDGLQQMLDSIRTINTATTEKLEQTTTELFTAYYVIGSAKELKDKGIINSEGFLNLKKKVLNKDYDTQYFTEIDQREVTKIETFTKKAKVMTNHPESSYKLETDSKGIVTIAIKDTKAFWSVSKFLVVQGS